MNKKYSLALAEKIDSILKELEGRAETGLTLAEHHATKEASEVFNKLVNQFTALRKYLSEEERAIKTDKDVIEEIKRMLLPIIKQESNDIQDIVNDLTKFLRAKEPREREKWLELFSKALRELEQDHNTERDLLRRMATKSKAA